ncbi:MAG: GNAT family N-acetyltransferase [Anaerolineales bacterium]|nr:GNAT family N-acetyltransferase [Anaerolineales bacterium]
MDTLRFSSRPCRREADLPAVLGLVAAHPAGQRHVADLPYRLASWALDDPDNGRCWHTAGDALAGFAVLQGPWGTLDLGVTPAARAAGLEGGMLTWAAARVQAKAESQGQPVSVYVEAEAGDAAWRAAAEAAGFHFGAYELAQFERPLAAEAAGPAVPAGFVIRPLRGEAECAAYTDLHRAAFGSANMTEAWRRRVVRGPGYAPDLDLVVETLAGQLAGFCIGWPAPDGAWAQVEPCGVHPDFQHRGLGRALLAELFRRMAARGARRAVVETYAGDDAAMSFYQSVGFQVVRRYLAGEQTFSPRPAPG